MVRAQVRARLRTVCKTVGSAYVGSNPTPATPCENGPLAANSRNWRAVACCLPVCSKERCTRPLVLLPVAAGIFGKRVRNRRAASEGYRHPRRPIASVARVLGGHG